MGRNAPSRRRKPHVVGMFDALAGSFASGWAIDMQDPETPLRIEAVCEGEIIGHGAADLFRGDVGNAGLPSARCGFRILLDRPIAELLGRDIHVRIPGTDLVLQGSPRQVTQNPNIARFLGRAAAIGPEATRRLARRLSHATIDTPISIVMPVHDPRPDWLAQALNSVLAQWSAHWELICVDDASSDPRIPALLANAARLDPRIRVLRTPANGGIARATNFALRAARHPYVAFMDHDDTIEPDAVYRLAQAARSTNADLLYSDEVLTTEDIDSIIAVRARPAFSYDYYLSHPYFVHMLCVRTDLACALQGWDETLPISADVDFVLRAIERARVITHVPGILYRWRTHETSAGHARKAEVMATTRSIIARHLGRRCPGASVQDGLGFNEFRIDWPDDGAEVLVVIPTKNRVDLLQPCIDSIEKTSPGENLRIVVIDHQSTDKKTTRYLRQISARHTVMPYAGVFNYARMNNLAVKTHGARARYCLFLNNDVEAIQPGWIARLRSLAAREGVGAVGPLLLYGDSRIQHAGVLVGFNDAADHVMKLQDAFTDDRALHPDARRNPGDNCMLTAVRDYSAVTAACMMVSRQAFRAVRGFDERFAIGFNDTDLCLRIGEAGYKILYDGHTVLYHHESATRTQTRSVHHPKDDARLRTRWRRFFDHGDPFYSPLLAQEGVDHILRDDPGCKGRMAPRATILDPG